MRLIKADKIFLLVVTVIMPIFVSVYLYMNNHSVEARKLNLMNLGMSWESAKQFYEGEEDGIYSPALQLAIIDFALFMTGVWFSGWIARSCGFLSEIFVDEKWQKFLTIISAVLFWLAIADIALYLMCIWKH